MATARFARSRKVLLSCTTVAAAFAAVVGAAGVTAAAPTLTVRQAEARVAALNHRAEVITEAYDAARQRLGALQREQLTAADALNRDQARLDAVRARIGATANAAYRTGGLGQYVLGEATNPQAFLDQAVTLDALSRAQTVQLATATAAGHDVRADQATYTARSAAVRATLAAISARRTTINRLLGQARAVVASLRAADRARLAAATAARASSQAGLRGTYNGPASGRAATAVKFAYAQLGKPYVYGASGPSSYDCSGLTMAAWGAAGVSLPHNAAMQQSDIPAVSESNLQPGDLVFFGSPAYHTAIYIGGGNIIEAPHTGDVVKIVSLSYMPDYSGAGRP